MRFSYICYFSFLTFHSIWVLKFPFQYKIICILNDSYVWMNEWMNAYLSYKWYTAWKIFFIPYTGLDCNINTYILSMNVQLNDALLNRIIIWIAFTQYRNRMNTWITFNLFGDILFIFSIIHIVIDVRIETQILL